MRQRLATSGDSSMCGESAMSGGIVFTERPVHNSELRNPTSHPQPPRTTVKQGESHVRTISTNNGKSGRLRVEKNRS